MKKFLGLFAHPADESYLVGGTIAKYIKAGYQVDLVMATRGEHGMPGQYGGATNEEFATIRQKELEVAASHLGVQSITFLDYKDDALSNMNPGDIEDKLVSLLIETRPDVVVTFEPAGINNNPDHMKLSLSVTFAFQKYAGARNAEAPEDTNPPKLYFVCMPESVVSYFIKKRYIPAESFDKPWQGIEDKKITTVIDISKVKAIKERALRAHASQAEHVEPFLSIEHNPFLRQEYFILRYVGMTEAFMGKNDRVSDRL